MQQADKRCFHSESGCPGIIGRARSHFFSVRNFASKRPIFRSPCKARFAGHPAPGIPYLTRYNFDFLTSTGFDNDISEFKLAFFYSPLRPGRKKGTDNEIANVSKIPVSWGYSWLFRYQSLFAPFCCLLRAPYAIPTRPGSLNLQ